MRIKEYRTELDKDKKNVLCEIGYYDVTEDRFDKPEKIARFAINQLHLDRRAEEYVYVVGLTTKTQALGVFEISHGAVSASICNPREIFIRLLLCGASTFVMIHNHPSGDTKTQKKEFIYLNLEKESDMPIRRECPKIILNLLSDTDDENSQEWRKQCHKSLQIKRKLLKLDGLPEGTRIQFPSLLSFSNGVEKGDSIILLKSNRKWIWEKYQYRFMKSYINPDYTILQKEEIK